VDVLNDIDYIPSELIESIQNEEFNASQLTKMQGNALAFSQKNDQTIDLIFPSMTEEKLSTQFTQMSYLTTSNRIPWKKKNHSH
jgi:hypothetical protein